jgi:hypothetical protein
MDFKMDAILRKDCTKACTFEESCLKLDFYRYFTDKNKYFKDKI